MDLTKNEKRVIDRLRKRRVGKITSLGQELDVSTKTVQRALAKVDHLASVNQNGTFVALKETAQFDEHGLWTCREACFSKHGRLAATIVALVQRAPVGYTAKELEQLLGTRVHNHVSQLIREGKLTRFSLDRHAVYLSPDHRRQAKQWAARQKEVAPDPAPATDLPPGLDAVTVIRVLVRLLQTPEASTASVARWLQARNVAVRADQIRHILDFYGLKKTTL